MPQQYHPIPNPCPIFFGLNLRHYRYRVTSPRWSKTRTKLLAMIRRVTVAVRILSGKANEQVSINVDGFMRVFLLILARFSWPEDPVCVFCKLNNFEWNVRKYLGAWLKRVLALFVGLVFEFFSLKISVEANSGSCYLGSIFAKNFRMRHLDDSCQLRVKCADSRFAPIFWFFDRKTLFKVGHFLG